MSLFRALILSPFLLRAAWAAAVAVDFDLDSRDSSNGNGNGISRLEQRSCADVHLFLARGNGESYPGRVGAMYNSICDGLPSCDYENIEFDSSQSYCQQASDGVSSGQSQIAAYASSCPKSKLVLAGYSLGAQIVGDILGGGGGTFYTCVESNSGGLQSNTFPGNHIAAVLLFGDVRHVAYEPYNVGDGSGDNGQYPRSGSSLSILNEYSSITQSYCLASDPICALGPDGESHTTYMTVYASSAGAWAQQVLGYAGGSGSSSNEPSTSSTPVVVKTSTPSPTPTYVYTPTTTPSSSSKVESTTSTTPITTSHTSTTSSSSIVSSSSNSTSSVNTSTFVPFSFSDTPSVATTLTSPSVTLSLTATSTTAPVTTSSPSAVEASSSTPAPASTKSKAGAAVLGAGGLTLNLVTLVVIKVLAF